MFKSRLNSVLTFTLLLHKVAASPSTAGVLICFLAVDFGVLHGARAKGVTLSFTCRLFFFFPKFAVSDAIRLRSEFRLCPEASAKQDCGKSDKVFSHWR